jgi:hypothetical protein
VYLRAVDLNLDDAEVEVTELHAIFMAPKVDGRETADMFQIIGTVEKPDSVILLKILLDLIKSLHFT